MSQPEAPMTTSPWRNWAGTETAEPTRTLRPEDAEEVAAAVAAAAEDGLRVKAVGSGHSFSGIAAPTGCCWTWARSTKWCGSIRRRTW
ncbi:hypothetical protein GCM10029992_61390 [Glycomyces albus]